MVSVVTAVRLRCRSTIGWMPLVERRGQPERVAQKNFHPATAIEVFPVYSLLYVSSAVKTFTQDELADLLQRARRNNAVLDVTGMLVYKDGNFMQLLEGKESVVRDLYARIIGDLRHKGQMTLLKGPVAKRSFAEWHMGFRNLQTSDATSLPGYSDFMNTPLNSQYFSDSPAEAQKLLLMFREKM